MRNAQAHRLQELLRLNRRLKDIVQTDFEALPLAYLHWKPDVAQWSIAQCLEHLCLILKTSLPHLQSQTWPQKPSEPNFHTGFWADYGLRKWRVDAQNRPTRHLQAPPNWQPQTQASLNFAALFDLWAQFIQRIEEAFFKPLNRCKLRLPGHSFLRINLGNALELLTAHLERHVLQAQRLRLRPEFPANTANLFHF